MLSIREAFEPDAAVADGPIAKFKGFKLTPEGISYQEHELGKRRFFSALLNMVDCCEVRYVSRPLWLLAGGILLVASGVAGGGYFVGGILIAVLCLGFYTRSRATALIVRTTNHRVEVDIEAGDFDAAIEFIRCVEAAKAACGRRTPR